MTDYNVSTQHPEYEFYYSLWKESSDFCRNEKAVKESPMIQDYLPNPNTNLNDPNRATNYALFVNEAPFMGFAGKTLKATAATITRKEPVYDEVTETLSYLIENANGGGLGLSDQTSRALIETAQKGRFGLLTELPVTNGELSMADNNAGMMPTIQGYTAESIINWNETNGKLDLVVLTENVRDDEHLFGNEFTTQYRVLLLEDGIYKQRLYSDPHNLHTYEEIEVSFNGQNFDYIPFDFIGAENNDPTCDEPPIQEIVTLNRDHFRVSAKDMNIINATSMVMTAISTRMDSEEISERFPNGISYGAKACYFLPEDSKVEVVQARESNSAARKAAEIVQSAISMGAKLVMPKAQETATAAEIANNTENVVIVQIAKNVEKAFNNQLRNIALVLSDSNESKLVMNKDTGLNTMTPQERKAWQEDVVLGYVTLEDYQKRLRLAGELDESESNQLAVGLADAN